MKNNRNITLIFIISLFIILDASGDPGDPKCGPDWTIVGSNYCYRIGSVAMTWYDADTECKKMDSTLVRLYDQSVVVSCTIDYLHH